MTQTAIQVPFNAMTINKLLTMFNFSDCNNVGRIKYIVIHYVGATGGAEANCKYFADTYRGASAHYFVGFSGEYWQAVEDEDIAWHCGASSYKHPECRNSNSIGIELCVRCKGSQSADSKDWYFEDATVKAAIVLVKALMKKYNIPADHVIRHYDVTGKICPNPYVYNSTEHTWELFKKAISEVDEAPDKSEMTKIGGKAEATAEQMTAYIKKVNPSVQKSVLDMIPLYLSEGEMENIRGDIAFAQSCLETGNFAFKGSAVELKQNNFCGMGVTQNGMQGNSFATPQLGIRAQIQHLKAYANTTKLKGECVDPRFEYVKRGSASYVEYLGIQENPKGVGWASGAGYGSKILTILGNILKTDTGAAPSNPPSAPPSNPEPPKQEDFKPYLINTTCDSLNIRSGAGTGYGVVGVINEKEGRKNKYTIVEEKSGWGRLKSGAGWISLSYCKKVGGVKEEDVFHPYTIKTTCDVLNIRSGAGSNTPVVGSIKETENKKKLYTIVEESNGWGRLKSGAGWICLAYTVKAS